MYSIVNLKSKTSSNNYINMHIIKLKSVCIKEK